MLPDYLGSLKSAALSSVPDILQALRDTNTTVVAKAIGSLLRIEPWEKPAEGQEKNR